MKATKAAEGVVVMEGDRQVVSQVGLHLLGDLADRAGLTSAYSAAMPWTGERAPGQDRGRLLAQVAVMLAGGGECVSDLAALRDQPALFGDVASSSTTWRAMHSIDDAVLDALRRARAAARSTLWASGGAPEEVILDVDAALVEIHSANKERASSHFQGGFGFHAISASSTPAEKPWPAHFAPATPPPTPVPTSSASSTSPSTSCPPSTAAGTVPATMPPPWRMASWCVPTAPVPWRHS